MAETFLTAVTVIEAGDRLATGLCGALLQRLGAEVIVIEPAKTDAGAESKWPHKEVLGAGKRALVLDACSAPENVAQLIANADVVITSSDWSSALPPGVLASMNAAPIVCDITAFGSTGPLAGRRYSDVMMQAFAGLMDTTGAPHGGPVATRIPVTECSAAVYAAAGVTAALRARRRSAADQRVEVALFDTAFTLLSTFLPKHFVGETPTRMGNRHPSMSPWNAFRARDGWVVLCSASDDMWGRVCDVIGRPELKRDPRFCTMPGRVENAEAADAAIEPWVASRTVAECLDAFSTASVPCGPVYTTAEALADHTLRMRGAVCRLAGIDGNLLVPGGLIHGIPATGRVPQQRLRQLADVSLERMGEPRRVRHSGECADIPVLDGIRVLEMGSYTTAPLAARQLGALGADVVKLEPPAGELSRASPPFSDGQSYFCTLSNSDKRSVAIDLKRAEDRALFRELLARADVFVENMKPGVLARCGFGRAEIAVINPRLVYCSVSGYGADMPLGQRPAMDTTIQGTAGVMDRTRDGGVPFKVGVSISDILGGQFALLAILAALEYRERTGKGEFIDLSMQELSAWLTQVHWNGDDHGESDGRLVRCREGYLYIAGPKTEAAAREAECMHRARVQAIAELGAQGIVAIPVQSVSEVGSHAQTAARELILMRPDRRGKLWPLLACPVRLAPVAPAVRRATGRVGEDVHEVLRDWGVVAPATAGGLA